MNSSFLDYLVCPRDKGDLRQHRDYLTCDAGHTYPLVDDIPVMLLDDVTQTMKVAESSLVSVKYPRLLLDDPLCLATVGISDDERRGVRSLASNGKSPIDPVVSYLVAATNGLMYKHLIGKVNKYPIPDLRLPPGAKRTLLDIGCSWGRWSIAAARKGYDAIGIDPSLGAIMAAKRVSRSLGLPIKFVVGDARYLPFRNNIIDSVFSYSVLQHFSRSDVTLVLEEVNRTLKPGGASLVQMPTTFGPRCLYHQMRRGFRDGAGFDVRYWSIPRLRRAFSKAIGRTTVSVDCYLGIGLQPSDAAMMTPALRLVLSASEALRQVSHILPFFQYFADSVYLHSAKPSSTSANFDASGSKAHSAA